MDNRVAPQSPKIDPRLRIPFLALLFLSIVLWIAAVLSPLLPEPLYREVRGVLHVLGAVMGPLILVGVAVFVFWIKRRLSPAAAQALRAAEERERQRSRSAGPGQVVAMLLVFGGAIAICWLLKSSGLVTDRRALYACALAIPVALFLGGYGILRSLVRRGP
jgi:hypothetical protein